MQAYITESYQLFLVVLEYISVTQTNFSVLMIDLGSELKKATSLEQVKKNLVIKEVFNYSTNEAVAPGTSKPLPLLAMHARSASKPGEKRLINRETALFFLHDGHLFYWISGMLKLQYVCAVHSNRITKVTDNEFMFDSLMTDVDSGDKCYGIHRVNIHFSAFGNKKIYEHKLPASTILK